MEVILDTSFILNCLKVGIDFLEAVEYGKVVIAREVVEELGKLAQDNSKLAEQAKLALEIIERNKVKMIKLNSGHVDAGIIKYVRNKQVIVATMDSELKRKLKKKSKLLIIRGKKKLELE